MIELGEGSGKGREKGLTRDENFESEKCDSNAGRWNSADCQPSYHVTRQRILMPGY